jgi:hypothetical protein
MLMRAASISGKSRYAYVSISPQALEGVLRSLNAGPAKEFGIEIVYTKAVSAGASDYSEVCRAAAGARAELMTIAADFATQTQVLESCTRVGFTPVYVTTGSLTDQRLLETSGKHLDGAIGMTRTVPWFLDQPADLTTFRSAMKAAGLEVNASTLGAWASGRIFEQAIRGINGEISPKTVAQALRALNGQDLGGLVAPLRFSSSPSQPNPGANCFWPLVAKNGAWTVVGGGKTCLP